MKFLNDIARSIALKLLREPGTEVEVMSNDFSLGKHADILLKWCKYTVSGTNDNETELKISNNSVISFNPLRFRKIS